MLSIRRFAPETIVLSVFFCSRVAYYLSGIHFDAGPVVHFWQFIDPALMRSDLLRSLFYLHMQPPGFNLFVGIVVKLFPYRYAPVLHSVYLICGIVSTVLIMRLMACMGVSRNVAVVFTAILIVSPGFVITENVATYEYPIMTLLLIATFALQSLIATERFRWSALFFSTLLVLFYIRNEFHVVYIVVIAAALLYWCPRIRPTVVSTAVPAICAALALYFKNWLIFGLFTASTWLGMNLGVVTTFQLTPDEANHLIAEGMLSPVARIRPFSKFSAYRDLIPIPPKTGLPILDETTTSTGHPNFNAIAYLPVHALYTHDAKVVLRHFPRAYLRSCAVAWFTYFLPASDVWDYDDTRRHIGTFDRIFSAVFFGKFRAADNRKGLRSIETSGHTSTLIFYTGFYLLVLLPVVFLWGVAQIILPARRARWQNRQVAVLCFAIFNIAFVTGVSNFLSSFENNRYRFPLDPLFTILAAMAVTCLVRSVNGDGHALLKPGPDSTKS